MTTLIPPNYYEVGFVHTRLNSARPAVCVLGVNYTGSSFSTDFPFVALAWANNMMQSVNSEWTLHEVHARDQLGQVVSLALGTAGSASHPAAPPNVSFLQRKKTGLGGRRNHGRLYLPGVSEQDIDDGGIVSGSKLTELNNNMSNMLSAWQTVHFFYVLLHEAPHAPTPITQFQWDDLCATQRRRLRK